MSIITLGSRIHSGFCLKCGVLLMHPYNDYQMCPECTEWIGYILKKFEKKKAIANKKRKSVKTDKSHVMHSRNVMRQVAPIGVPVK